MKPIGPLMREHRLIERMVSLLDRQLQRIKKGQAGDASLLVAAVDFFRSYADRTHHGKEEDILFRDLAKKPIEGTHKRVMDELVQEHIAARQMVSRLAEAAVSYGQGNIESLEAIKTLLAGLVQFYPAHILKEDQHFFFPIQEYFSKPEQEAMLNEFWDFDRKLIHEKYLRIVEDNEKRSQAPTTSASS